MGVFDLIKNNNYKKTTGVYAMIQADPSKREAEEKRREELRRQEELRLQQEITQQKINDAINNPNNIINKQVDLYAKEKNTPSFAKQGTWRLTGNSDLGDITSEGKEKIQSLPSPIKGLMNAKTNYALGDAGLDEAEVWNEIRKANIDIEKGVERAEEAKKKLGTLEQKADIISNYQNKLSQNEFAGQGNALTKDFAQYLPQLGRQMKAGLSGAAGGASAGAGVGATAALVAGQLGPQVAIPEELATVPGAALFGAIKGGKAGYVAGTAKYGYDTMAGMAYKSLIDLGVPNEIALDISKDEAIINSFIEGGGAIVDIISLGLDKLGSKVATTTAQKVAKNRLLAAAKAYGMNVASEGIEEGLQEITSIGAEKVAMNKAGLERTATIQDDINRIKDSTIGGLKVAAISGLGMAGGNYAVNTAINNISKQNNIPSVGLKSETVQNNVLPTQKIQETVQSAKIAGMTDIDIKRATDLNNMIQSGAKLYFYDPENLPQNIASAEIDKAKIANGFYANGVIYINKNSRNKVEQILGHELTHYLETTKSYTELANTILDSEAFYSFLAEKGFNNIQEYKNSLKEYYSDEQLDSEMVARFVEEKLFTDQESINVLARQNSTLAQKIKAWLDDMVVKFTGTTQEKELRKIQNMYKKALEQARNNTSITNDNAKYYIEKVADFNETEYNDVKELQLSKKEYGKLAHMVDSDTSIKAGLNIIETTDASYLIYYKDYNEFKVVDKHEGGVENDTTANRNVSGIATTGDERSGKSLYFDKLQEQSTRKSDDELFNGNKGKDSINNSSNNDFIEDKRNVAGDKPAFSLGENQQETLDRLNKEYDLYSRVRKDAYDRKAEVEKQYQDKINSQEYKDAWNYVKGLKASEILNSKEYQFIVEVDRLKKKMAEYQEEADMAYADMKRLAEAIDKEEKSHRNTADAIKQAKKTFGTTTNFKEAGYLLQDGSLLDFSGKNQGGPSGSRTIDHREINEVGYDMDEFIDIGNIRLKPENNGFELMHEPTEKQYATLKKYIENANGEVYIDIHKDNKMGRYDTKEYSKNTPASKIISDLQYYYKNGSFPYESDTQKFRVQFSLPDIDSRGRKLTAEQKELFKDSKIVDRSGLLKTMYHGTSQDFTVFDMSKIGGNTNNYGFYGDGFYFTPEREIAKLYAKYDKEPLEVYLNIKNPFNYNSLHKYNGEEYYTDYMEIRNLTKINPEWENIKTEYSSEYTWGDLARDIDEMLKNGGSDSEIDNLMYEKYGEIPEKINDRVYYYSKENGYKTLREALIEKGYDGIVNFENAADSTEIVAFYPEQIKNVDNKKPTTNPDIRYSVNNPVNIAKNPPNVETGLDEIKKRAKEKQGDSYSKFASSVQRSSIFGPEIKKLARDNININTYNRLANKDVLIEANDKLNEGGQSEVTRLLSKSEKAFTPQDVAESILLMDRYQQTGDYASAIEIMTKLRKAGTSGGQTIQMFSLLGRMTPEGMTFYAQKTLDDAYDEILKNKTQAWANENADKFKLTDKDIEYIQRRVNQASKLPEGRDKYVLLGEIAERVQSKIPPTAGQSTKSLARISMLLNPKTIVRNILGNLVIAPNHIISDFVGTGLDKAISKKTGVRTTGILRGKDTLKGMAKGAYESFDDFRRKISTREVGNDRFEIQDSGRSFNENHTGKLVTQRNKLSKALNGLDRVTGFLLEAGDRPIYEGWFINSLNNQMELNKVTFPTAEMIEIATDEALQRTWQDNNTYTKVVSSVRNGLNKLNVKGYGLGDMVMPFVKTPANLTKAVVDFSPLGAINALLKTAQFNKDIGKGAATSKQQREVVKAWSQVITGTLGMAIMAGLANAGALSGKGDEDKDVRAFEQNILGIKPYSIKIGDKSYTYDWAQPLGTTAAMVTDTAKSLKEAGNTENKVSAVLNGLQSGASVLLDQSFVSGIRNLFEEDNLINALIETAMNEPAKFTPQTLGQIAQIGDKKARTTYVYNDKLATGINKVKAKIPGLRQTLEPSVDVLGREVEVDNSVGNVMFNPANTAYARTTKAAEEMYNVYQATGDKAVIAQVAPYYFNNDGKKVILTPKLKTQYQKTLGKISSDGVENLLKNKTYNALQNTDKAEILKDLYSYAGAMAKKEADNTYSIPKDIQKIVDSKLSPEEYILLRYIANSSGSKKDEMYNGLIESGYSKKNTESFLTEYKGYKFTTNAKNTLPTYTSKQSKLPTFLSQNTISLSKSKK